MRYSGAVIIIPTRDRVDLLANAVRSVLSQSDSVHVLVSDNSTSAENHSVASQFCREFGTDRLRYISPPEQLPMSQHWNWAMEQALTLYSLSHFSVLTDRMVFKPDSLNALSAIISNHPDRVLTYMHDRVDDFARPYKVFQNEWNGKLYEVDSRRVLQLSADSVMCDAYVPRMLNCFVPRTVLDAIKTRFGNVFCSIAPDWNFAYRLLSLVDSFLFYHKALLVHYALARSNGESAQRGIRNKASEQFLRDLPAGPNVDAPYPEIITVWNAVIHEYVSVKNESGTTRFPKLNMKRYTEALAAGIKLIEDEETRQKMSDMLRARGWQPSSNALRQLSLAIEMMSVRQMWSLFRSLTNPARFRTFETPQQALEFAVTRTKPAQKVVWDEALHQGLEVLAPGSPATGESGRYEHSFESSLRA